MLRYKNHYIDYKCGIYTIYKDSKGILKTSTLHEARVWIDAHTLDNYYFYSTP